MSGRVTLLLIFCLVLVACGPTSQEAAPTPTLQAASTLFAQPTRAPRVTPSPTPLSALEFELNRTVARMERAVQTANLDTYLSFVWAGDPIFLAEHSAWARDWVEYPLAVFEMELFNIRALSPQTAIARMSWRWRQATRSGDDSAGGTTMSVIFYRQDERWLLGGEHWTTAEVPGFRLYYLTDVVDNSQQAQTMLDYLPEVHAAVTRAFAYTPQQTAHIKLYESPTVLFNWTRLSQPDLTSWNAPGQAIKLALTPIGTAPDESVVAREYTRFLLFELAGGARERFPWWLEEGIAEYGGSLFSTLSQRNRTFKRIAALALAPETSDERLLRWDELTDPAVLSADERDLTIRQAFVLVHYVTEAHGIDARNAWIHAIARGQSLDAACQSALGLSFGELDAAWRAWLPSQL